ncbi:MAG: radical SAM protein [Methanobacterium sp.]|nr:radical SAM protein [Methanobacterium sp.]
MKIALIFPRYKYPSGDAPLGIAYIASYLRKNAKNIEELEIIDTTFHKNKNEIKEILLKKKYDIVGFSVMTTMYKDAVWIAEYIKKIHPKTIMVFGGPHATILSEDTIKEPCVDIISIGEGEKTFYEIIKNKGNCKNIKGIWYKKNGKIIKNKKREPIKNLDTLPFPAYDLLPMDKYMKNWFQLDSVSTNLKGINIITSRGCPFQCTYCQPTLFKIFGNVIRKRSSENIIKELIFLKKNYNINAFMFNDDTLVFNKDWVHKTCDLLISKKINLLWGCNSRANLIDENLFKKMKLAGLKKVNIGMESGSQRILDEVYHKKIKISDIEKAVKIMNKLEIKVQGYFMLGAPGESMQEIKKTIDFAKNLKINEVTFSITTPLPGTYLYDMTKDKINKKITDFDYYKNSVYSSKLGEKRLQWLKKQAILSFYLNPKRILDTLKSFMDLQGIKKNLIKLKRF